MERKRERDEASKSKALAKGKAVAGTTTTKGKEAVSSKQQAGREEKEEKAMKKKLRREIEREFLDIEAAGARKAPRAQNKRRRTEPGAPEADAERVKEIIDKWSALGWEALGKAWGKSTWRRSPMAALRFWW